MSVPGSGSRSASRLLVVAVGLAVALAGAGCVGLAGEEPETLTPAPVPTPTPTMPAGVDADGIDRVTLVETHGRSLNATSYRFTDRHRIVLDGEVVRSGRSTRWVAPNGTYNGTIRQRVSGYPIGVAVPNLAFFYNGSVAAQRYRIDGETSYRFDRDPAEGLIQDRSGRFPILRHLQGFAGTVRASPPTSQGVILRGSGVRVPHAVPLPTGVSDPRNGTLRVHVRPDGVVSLLRAEYTVTAPSDRPARVVRTIRVSRVGSTTVRTPDWVGAAAAARSDAQSSRDSNSSTIAE